MPILTLINQDFIHILKLIQLQSWKTLTKSRVIIQILRFLTKNLVTIHVMTTY